MNESLESEPLITFTPGGKNVKSFGEMIADLSSSNKKDKLVSRESENPHGFSKQQTQKENHHEKIDLRDLDKDL